MFRYQYFVTAADFKANKKRQTVTNTSVETKVSCNKEEKSLNAKKSILPKKGKEHV